MRLNDRREFLRYAAAAAAAPLARAVGPDIIRVGLLGSQHSHLEGKLQAMKNSPADYQVVSICEPDAAARARGEKNPAFAGLRWVHEQELLADPSLHLIVVECKIWEALPWGRKVIAAGKHLHLEKPPGNEWAPFREMVEEARRKKLLLQTGYMWRWHEGMNAAIEAARKGWLGEVYMMRGSINADRTREARVLEAKYKGGGFFELGGHLIDRVVELWGRPKKITSILRHHTSIDDSLADSNVAVLEYGKSLAVITQAPSMYGSDEHRSFELLGTDGSVIVQPAESRHPKMKVGLRKAQGPYKAGWQEITLAPQPRFIGDFKELARAIKSGQPLKLSYDHELTVHETLLRAAGELNA